MHYRRMLGALIVALVIPIAAQAQILSYGSITAQDAGSCATVNACVTFMVPANTVAITLQASGTFSGMTGTIEGTSDGTNWGTLTATRLSDGAAVTTITAAGQFVIPNTGLLSIRVRGGAFASGTATIYATRGFVFARLLAPVFTTVNFNGSGSISAASDGVLTLLNNAGTDFSRLQFGGTTSSFPSLKRRTSVLDIRFADDSGYSGLTGNFDLCSGCVVSKQGNTIIAGIAPTISSGFGTSPSIVANNGTAAFTLNVGAGGAATSGVIGLPAATTGWNCFAIDRTTNVVTRETSTTTTTATLTAASAWGANDILQINCFAY